MMSVVECIAKDIHIGIGKVLEFTLWKIVVKKNDKNRDSQFIILQITDVNGHVPHAKFLIVASLDGTGKALPGEVKV